MDTTHAIAQSRFRDQTAAAPTLDRAADINEQQLQLERCTVHILLLRSVAAYGPGAGDISPKSSIFSIISVISIINIMSRRKSASTEACGAHTLHFSPIYCSKYVLLVLEDHGGRGERCPKSHISLLWSDLFLVVLRTLCFTKRFFSVPTFSKLLSGTVPPLCTIVSCGKSNCFAPTMCTGAQDDKYTNIYS